MFELACDFWAKFHSEVVLWPSFGRVVACHFFNNRTIIITNRISHYYVRNSLISYPLNLVFL